MDDITREIQKRKKTSHRYQALEQHWNIVQNIERIQ